MYIFIYLFIWICHSLKHRHMTQPYGNFMLTHPWRSGTTMTLLRNPAHACQETTCMQPHVMQPHAMQPHVMNHMCWTTCHEPHMNHMSCNHMSWTTHLEPACAWWHMEYMGTCHMPMTWDRDIRRPGPATAKLPRQPEVRLWVLHGKEKTKARQCWSKICSWGTTWSCAVPLQSRQLHGAFVALARKPHYLANPSFIHPCGWAQRVPFFLACEEKMCEQMELGTDVE